MGNTLVLACSYPVRLAVVDLGNPPEWWQASEEHLTAAQARQTAGTDGMGGVLCVPTFSSDSITVACNRRYLLCLFATLHHHNRHLFSCEITFCLCPLSWAFVIATPQGQLMLVKL